MPDWRTGAAAGGAKRESILAIARYLASQQSMRRPTGARALRLLPISSGFVFFFDPVFDARGAARYARWLPARDVTAMMKLSPVTNMDYPRILLFSFSNFYFSHYVVQVL